MASTYDFVIEQGSTFAYTIAITADGAVVNLTGYTAKLQAKTPNGTTLFTLTGGSGLTLHNALGTIDIGLTATQTAALSFVRAVYDLMLTDSDNNVLPRFRGAMILIPSVTQ